MNTEIYGYQPSQNNAFTDVVRSLTFDAKARGLAMYSLENTLSTFRSLVALSLNETTKGKSSLAIIGFVELLVIKQAQITESMLLAFQDACKNDPLLNCSERLEIIADLKTQLGSYIKDYRVDSLNALR